MRIRTLIFLCFTFLKFTGLSKSGILDLTISIEIKSTPVKLILHKIEELGGVKFSYNPEIIDENRLVSLNIKNRPIRYGLSLIFDGSVRFKEVGEHIVLLKNEDKNDVRAREKQNDFYTFTGRITDELTGEPISGASIYDVDSRYAVLTDKNGRYSLSVPMSESIRSLYFSRKGYKRKVIVIDASIESDLVNNMMLSPIQIEIEKITGNDLAEIPKGIEYKALSGEMVSYETFKHGENLPEINESRIAQISLVPSLSFGSNLSTNGLIINKFSLNILAGYSKGVDGFEFGGVANLVNGDVRWCQIGGIANLVRGDVIGLQIAGIANLNQGNIKGLQFSGISSITKRDVDGVQISGISSIVRGGFNGAQISGISNLAFQKSNGVQIAGIFNQVIDTLVGSQISGIGNSALKGTTFGQISGILNLTNVNVGLQISSILNHANHNKGLQIGLINTSKKSTGIALGLINFVAQGYHEVELSTNEVFQANLVFKSGVKRLYNTYSFGVRFEKEPIYAGGLGLGTYFDLSEKTMLSLDVSSQITFNSSNYNSLLNKLSLTFDYKPAKWITIFAGPSLNTNLLLNGGELIELGYKPLYEEELANGSLDLWLGGQFGIRF